MKISRTTLITVGVFLACGAIALASGSGIPQLDSASQTANNIFKGVVGILGLGLFVGLLVEFSGHKHLGKMAIELVGIIICIILAVNSQAVLALFGVQGATVSAVAALVRH